MNRIKRTDNLGDMVPKMAARDVSALRVLMEIVHHWDDVDPAYPGGAEGMLCQLDELRIYGHDIYRLLSSVCRYDTRKMFVLIRATQLGLFSPMVLRALAGDKSENCSVAESLFTELNKKVCDHVPEFAKLPKIKPVATAVY